MAGKNLKKGGLGRGLDALFAEQQPIAPEKKVQENDEPEGNRIQYININDIKPNLNQPRQVFQEEKIRELSESITAHGIIQPLVVRRSGKQYEIVAGERRWRAARLSSLTEVPCIVRDFNDEENMLIAIIENMQREDLNPIEEAMGLNEMIKAYGMTQEEVSRSVSKSRPYITNALRLLKLPESIQNYVSEGSISTGHARALVGVRDRKLQGEIARRVVDEGISVREVEKMIADVKMPQQKKAKKKVKGSDILAVEEELKNVYGTKVSIISKGRKGKIEMEYYSKEELNRLIDLLKSIH